jgi:hypothetical protein
VLFAINIKNIYISKKNYSIPPPPLKQSTKLILVITPEELIGITS